MSRGPTSPQNRSSFFGSLSVHKVNHLTFRIRKRVPRLSPNIFAWPLAIWRADFEDIKRVNGLDAYFFVRFLRMMAIMFLPIWFISWAVLLPITVVGTQVSGLSGLDRLTFGNVENTKQTRYVAHLVLAWLFTCTSFDRLAC
jgi:calcium permeable stress-gated cation channel